MKAFVAYAPGEMRFIDVDVPKPGPREVLAKVAHCGVCATDVSIMNGTLNLGKGTHVNYPVRLGHEWSGVVVEVGDETRRLKPGDGIISDTGYSCGECAACLRGEYHHCERGRAIGTVGNCWPGAFAEYMLIPERLAFKVPDGVGLDEAALVEPASIGLYGLLRAGIEPEKTLLVVGTGAIGLGGMACARGLGVGKIILAGRKWAKLEVGRALGADVLVNMAEEDLPEAVRRECGKGRGADIVMDTTGAPELFNLMAGLTRSGGSLVIPAFYEKPLDGVELDRLIARDCTLIGAAGTPNMGRKILSLMEKRGVRLLPMITDRFPFERADEAFRAVRERNESRVKVMVDFE